MNSKIFNYKLSWVIGKMCLCGQVVGVQVQDQVSKKDILEFTVKCVGERVGMRGSPGR